MYIKSFFSAILIIMFSCTNEDIGYLKKFNLNQYKSLKYDYYNPILNKFKIDSLDRLNHPDYYQFEAYYDDNEILRYLFYKSESYGYLHEFFYKSNKLMNVKIYPILSGNIDKGAKILTNEYFYLKDELVIFKDELSKELVFVYDDSIKIYKGVLDSSINFDIEGKLLREYYIKYLN